MNYLLKEFNDFKELEISPTDIRNIMKKNIVLYFLIKFIISFIISSIYFFICFLLIGTILVLFGHAVYFNNVIIFGGFICTLLTSLFITFIRIGTND
jgi:hypothetical protein